MRRKLALCVGINDYPGTGADLAGCVNDARDWKAALLDRGYKVVALLDAEATAARVRSELRAMVADARFGDRIVFTFSGHGTWVPDRDGDEPDARDEALCMHDYAVGGLLLDDELHEIVGGTRWGVRSTIISDSCHSGTMMRLAAPKVEPSARARFLPPPGMSTWEAAVIEDKLRRRGTSRPTGVLVSGCADMEFSYDAWFGARPNGAMSRYLLDAIGSGSPSVATAFRGLRAKLPSGDYPQTPQLTATAYQRRSALL